LANPVWWKLKTSRWRGAVYEDADGQAWFCAAGLRREGELTDFYASFMASVQANGPEPFLPTDDDRARLQMEEADARLARWEEDLYEAACTAFVTAVERGTCSFSVPGMVDERDLCRVEITVESLPDDDEDEGLAEVVLAMKRLDWSWADLAEQADLIILAAIEPKEQQWDTSASAEGPLYSLTTTGRGLHALQAACDSDGRAPGQFVAGSHAHYTHRERLTESTVIGSAVRSICGIWFVPRQDYERLEKCPACEALHRARTEMVAPPPSRT
jgi:hypothetical protein